MNVNIHQAIRKAEDMLGIIVRVLWYNKNEDLLELYWNKVRVHMEYCVQVTSPSARKDIFTIGVKQKNLQSHS